MKPYRHLTAGGGGGGTVTGTGVAGRVAFWSGLNSITSSADLLWNDGTKEFTINGKLTVTGVIDPTALLLAGTIADTYLNITGGSSVPVSAASEGRLRYNELTQKFEISENGGSWTDLSAGNDAWLVGGNTLGGVGPGSHGIIGTLDANGLAFYTNNTEWARFTTTGRFGVGTTGPLFKCEVAGSIGLGGATNDAFLNFKDGNASSIAGANQARFRYNDVTKKIQASIDAGPYRDVGVNAFVQGGNSFGAVGVLGTTDAQALSFIVNSVEVGRFNTSGRLGIGTTGPTQMLDVVGAITITGATNTSFMNFVNGNTSGVSGANNGRIRYNSTGQEFEVSRNTGVWTVLLTSSTGWVQGGNSFGTLGILGTNDAFGLAFETNNVECARFDSAGNFGIGTSTPTDKLHVIGDVTIDGKLTVTGAIDPTEIIFGMNENSLGFSTSNTPNSAILTVPSSRILHFCEEADKAFDWFNNAFAALPNPAFVFHTNNLVRNESGILGFINSDKEFSIIGTSGDDIDGAAKTDQGVDIKLQCGDGGSSGAGGRPGNVYLFSGSATTGNNNGGDIILRHGIGSGTGRDGAFLTSATNQDFRFKNNGTGVFRIIDSASTSSLTFDHDGTDAIYSASTGIHNFSQGVTINGLSFFNGAQKIKRTAVGAGGYSLDSQDYLVAKTAITGGGDTISLPTAASVSGQQFKIKDESGNASINNITIDPNGAETIDGLATILIKSDYGEYTIYSNGSAWFTA